MSKLLFDEHPLVILPRLAVLIGLNEAIVLQQLHYWLSGDKFGKTYGEVHDGRRWVYNTYEQWQEQFPFWSMMTVRRTLTSLRKPYTPKKDDDRKVERGPLVLVSHYNKVGFDKTNWWTIDYDEFNRLEGVNRSSVHFEQTICSK